MHPIISALLGAATLSGTISFHIATAYFAIVIPITEWFLTRSSFTLLFYAVSASIGIIFMTAGRKGSDVDEQVQKYGGSIALFYASAGGSILGWTTGICISAVLYNPIRYWPFAVLATTMGAIIVGAPLIGITVTRRMVTEFNNRWFRQRWREPYVRGLGCAMLVFSIVFLIYDLQN